MIRRGAVIVVALLALVLAALALRADSQDEGGGARSYEIVFDNAFGLTAGGDFKVAGVRVGSTSGFEVVGKRRPLALVRADVSETGLADLREDARCEIRPQSLIGEYFVDCQPGTSPRQLDDGARIPVERTSSTIPIDLVNDILRLPQQQRLRLIVAELGAGLAGRPGDLSDVLRRAHPGLRETSQTLRILGRQTATIERTIVDARTVVGALARRRTDVSGFVDEAGETAAIAASRRRELAETFRRLPGFLDELTPYMGRLGDLTAAQTPLLRDLQSASGELDTFLARLRPFAGEGRPALKALGRAGVVGRRAVRESQEEIAELRRLAADAPGLAKPLRQVLQSLDDRRRAPRPDARAASSGPPPGDPTHTTSARAGFTGLESLWNYFFWQALTTNAFDDVGHVLRLSVQVSGCSGYNSDPDPELLEDCRGFLGPTQPGVTTADPTERSPAAAGIQRVASPPAPAGPSPAPAAPADTALLDYLLGE